MLSSYSKISKQKVKKIIEHFVVDVTATQCAKLLSLNRNTINRYYNIFREKIADFQEKELQIVLGWVYELDESYFWWRRVKWYHGKRKRWRWTMKQPVFGIYERSWRIYTEIVPDCQKARLQAIIRWRIDPSSVINTDGRRWYDGLVDIGYDKHFRVNHSKNEFSNKSWVHINWIEAYRSFSKRRLAKFNWVKVNFYLHLKECERRYKKTDLECIKELCKMISPPWRKVAKGRRK